MSVGKERNKGITMQV